MDALFGTGLCNTFGYLNVDELKVLYLFDFVSGTKQIDDDVRILDHLFNLMLVFIVHAIVEPGPV